MYREPPPYFFTVILSPLDDMSYERCVHVCIVPSLTTLNIALRDHGKGAK